LSVENGLVLKLMDGWMDGWEKKRGGLEHAEVDIGSARLGGWLLLESVAGPLPPPQPPKRAFSARSTDSEQGVCLRTAPHTEPARQRKLSTLRTEVDAVPDGFVTRQFRRYSRALRRTLRVSAAERPKSTGSNCQWQSPCLGSNACSLPCLDGRASMKHKPPCHLPMHIKPPQPPSRLIGEESSTTTRSAGLSSCHGPDACEPDTISHCICCTAHRRLKHLQFFRATQHLHLARLFCATLSDTTGGAPSRQGYANERSVRARTAKRHTCSQPSNSVHVAELSPKLYRIVIIYLEGSPSFSDILRVPRTS
jgi:hypothetical protein